MKINTGFFLQFRSSLGTRINLWVILVLFVIFGLVTLMNVLYETQSLENKLASSANKLAEFVMSAIRYPMINGDQDVIQLQFEEFKKNLEANEVIHLLDEKGVIRRSTDKALIGQISLAEELESALKGNSFNGIEVRRRSGRKIFAKTEPIMNERSCYACHGKEKKVLGVLRVALDWENVEHIVRQSRNWNILYSLLGVIVLIFLLSWFIMRIVIVPLKKLETSMKKVSAGDLNQELVLPGEDEIAELATIFNKMTGDLRAFVGREQEFALAEKRRAETLVRLNNDLRNEIIERKKIEDVLKIKEGEINVINRQLMDIIDFLPDATFVVDRNRRVIAWNRAVEEMTGVSQEQMIGKTRGEYSRPFYGDEREILIDTFFDPHLEIHKRYDFVDRSGGRLRSEVFLPHLNRGKGMYVAVSATQFFDEKNQLTGAIESIRDITHRKTTEISLRESAERANKQQAALVSLSKTKIFGENDLDNGFEELTDLSAKALGVSRASVWLFSADKTSLECKKCFDRKEMVYSRGESVKVQSFPQYIHAVLNERVIDAADARVDERTRQLTDNYLTPNNIVSMLDAAIRVSGEVVGVVCFEQFEHKREWFVDEIAFAGAIAEATASLIVSVDRVRVQRELEKTYKNLKDAQEELMQAGKMAAMGQLAAGISHELNQPLTGIKGFAQVILQDVEGNPGIKNDLLKIIEQADRMDAIIKNVRFFSRKSDFVSRQVDIHKSIEDSLMLLAEQLRLHNINVVREYGTDLPLIDADPNHLQQVFVNLLTNAKDAIESTQSPGVITITTRASADRKHVEASVADSGCGIPPEQVESIFNPFFTTKSPSGGMGLGLSIVYRIIENHGGTIKVDSKVGHGTVMKITFPA